MKGTIIFDLEGTLVDVAGPMLGQVFVEENDLAELVDDYRIGIVTGATRRELTHVLKSTFLGDYFKVEYTITKDECLGPKASGKPFQRLLEKGIPRPVVIIGDSDGDRLGAAATNVPFVLVDPSMLSAGTPFIDYLAEARQLLV